MQMNPGVQMNQMNQMNYYNQQNQQNQVRNPIPNSDNILFVADLPDETSEEDLANFFKSYNFLVAKVFQ